MKDETLGRGVIEGVNPSLNERICFQIGDRLVFISAPYDGTNTRPMNMEAILGYCRGHPKARLLLWLNNVIKEL